MAGPFSGLTGELPRDQATGALLVSGSAGGAGGDASLVQCVGHSLTNGYGLADQSLRASSRLAGIFGSAQEWNQSISGASLGFTDVDTAGGVTWLWERVGVRRYRRTAPYSSASDVVIFQYGLNDMQAVGTSGFGATPSNTVGLNTFKNALRAGLMAFRCASWHATQQSSLDASVSLGGTWTAVANPATPPVGRKGSGKVSPGDGYRKTIVNGSTYTITVPSDYNGSGLFVLVVADPTTTTATLTATGAASGVFDLSGTALTDTVNTKKTLHVVRLTVPASTGATQSVVLTASAITGAGGINLAGWGIEAETTPLISVLNINKCNPAGSFWGGIQNSDVTTWNAGIQSVCSEFTDGNCIYTDVDTGLGGIGVGGSSSLTGTHTSGVTTLNVGSTASFPTTGTAMINPGLDDVNVIGQYGPEIVTWTGKGGTTLTGVVRGAYGSTAKAWDGVSTFNSATSPATPQIRQINQAAIQNFFEDGIHLSERGQSIIAQAVRSALVTKLSDSTTESYRIGPGRADVRCNLRTSRSQLFKNNGTIPMYWDISDIDTAMMHDPSAIAGTNGNPGPYSRVFCKSDGLYVATTHVQFEIGKAVSTGQVSTGGLRGLYIRKNGSGGPLLAASQMSVLTADTPNIFVASVVSLTTPPFEFRFGDYLEVLVNPTGVGTSANLTLAMTNVATNVQVNSTTGFVVNDIIRVDDEHMQVTVVVDATNLTVTRAIDGTTAVAHSTGTANVYSGVKATSAPTSNVPSFSVARLQAI